jgi:hypothetical protein
MPYYLFVHPFLFVIGNIWQSIKKMLTTSLHILIHSGFCKQVVYRVVTKQVRRACY